LISLDRVREPASGSLPYHRDELDIHLGRVLDLAKGCRIFIATGKVKLSGKQIDATATELDNPSGRISFRFPLMVRVPVARKLRTGGRVISMLAQCQPQIIKLRNRTIDSIAGKSRESMWEVEEIRSEKTVCL